MAVELEKYGIKSNPLHRVKSFKENLRVTQPWSKEELEQFLKWAFSDSSCSRSRRVLYLTLYELGLRVGEGIALMRDAIGENGSIHICRIYNKTTKQIEPTTKSGKARVLKASPYLFGRLKELLVAHMSKFLFVRENGESFTYDSIRHHFMKDQEKAEVRVINLHALRHTFCTHFGQASGNIWALKKQLGHAKIETTERYFHDSPEFMAEAPVRYEGTNTFTPSVIKVNAPRK